MSSTPAQQQDDKRRKRGAWWLPLCVLLAGLLATGVWWVTANKANDDSMGTPVWTPGAPSPTPPPRSTVQLTKDQQLAKSFGCATTASPIVPTSFQMPRLKLDLKVISVDYNNTDGTLAPPRNEGFTVAWIETQPKPGAREGTANLTAHTFRNGGALGNLLYNKGGIKAGDIIVLGDSSGTKLCYRYTQSLKIALKDYQPDSNVYYNSAGNPRIALMVCWDYNWTLHASQSRVIFYADPLAKSA